MVTNVTVIIHLYHNTNYVAALFVNAQNATKNGIKYCIKQMALCTDEDASAKSDGNYSPRLKLTVL